MYIYINPKLDGTGIDISQYILKGGIEALSSVFPHRLENIDIIIKSLNKSFCHFFFDFQENGST